MTILQASLDRPTADDVAVDTAGAADADLLGAAERRTFRAATLEDAVAAAVSELGDAVTVIEANRIRRGGLGGFFATDLGVEVIVEKSRSASGSTTDAVDRLLERFGERETDSFTPSIDRVELSRAAESRTPAARAGTQQTGTQQTGTQQTGTQQTGTQQTGTQPQRAAAVAARIDAALSSQPSTPQTAPIIDDDGPIFDLVEEDRDDEGPIFDLSDDADRDVDRHSDVDVAADSEHETPAAARRPTLTVDDDDDVFAPIAAEQHPFADQLEAELRAMSTAAESEVADDLVEPAVESIVEVEPDIQPIAYIEPIGETAASVPSMIEPAIPAGLVEAPRNLPPPILDMLSAPAREMMTTSSDHSPTLERSADRAIDEAMTEAAAIKAVENDAVAADAVAADALAADAVAADALAADDAALADLDALLRRAGVDPLAIVDAAIDDADVDVDADLGTAIEGAGADADADVDADVAPMLVDRPTTSSTLVDRPTAPMPMPSSGLVFDAADRLSEQLSAIDATSGRNEGLRRMQVKITGPDGTLVEMNAEWDERG